MCLTNVTLALLAGGESSRMGRPKGTLLIKKQPILEYLFERFAWPGPTLLITAPGMEMPPGAERFSNVATDAIRGRGPLQGFLTALDHSTTPCTLIAAVDMPRIGHAQLRFIAERLDASPALPGVAFQRAHPKRPTENKTEPLPCGLRRATRSAIVECLQSEDTSIHRLITARDFDVVDAPTDWPPEIWTNLNFPDDFERFRTISPHLR